MTIDKKKSAPLVEVKPFPAPFRPDQAFGRARFQESTQRCDFGPSVTFWKRFNSGPDYSLQLRDLARRDIMLNPDGSIFAKPSPVEVCELGGTRGGREDEMLRVGDVVEYAMPRDFIDDGISEVIGLMVMGAWVVYERGVFTGTKLWLEGVFNGRTVSIHAPSDDKRILRKAKVTIS